MEALCIARLNHEIAAFDITQFAGPGKKRLRARWIGLSRARGRRQISDAVDPVPHLGDCAEWCRKHAQCKHWFHACAH